MFSELNFKTISLTAIAIMAIAGFVSVLVFSRQAREMIDFERGEAESMNNLVPYAVYLGEFEDGLDLENIDEVFTFVFLKLESEITIYPSENYYYFSFLLGGKEVWGNIRLSPGRGERDGGYLNFGYREFDKKKLSLYKKFGPNDGLVIDKVSDLKYGVRYGGRTVVFNLSNLNQDSPDYIAMRDGETFVMRTEDESGYQFLLLFNEKTNDFLWVLDENQISRAYRQAGNIKYQILKIGKNRDFLLDNRTGFVFWDDKDYKRKVLVAVSKANISKNNYFDGPFDQLADNEIERRNREMEKERNRESEKENQEYNNILRFKDYLALAYPYLEGNIDEYGHLLAKESMRAAITPYYIYSSKLDLLRFLRDCEKKGSPRSMWGEELGVYRCLVRDEKRS